MDFVISGAKVYARSGFSDNEVYISGGAFADISPIVLPGGDVYKFNSNCVVFPGFVDVHVHLREPGFSYKETIFSGSRAAARGGFTTVCAMPNLLPVPDCAENLAHEMELIDRDAAVRVIPYASITVGQNGSELADMQAVAEFVCGFSDDGRGVMDDDMMRRAMLEAKRLGKLIVAHCEDETLVRGGYIHDGEYARTNGHIGNSSESEWRQVGRDLKLAEETGCAYHICHVSTKESVELIRRAKARGVDVTCETAPHYLLLDDSMLQDEGRFKMNPPIRALADRLSLMEGICDGTVDMIATDHAPHSDEEKAGGLRGSASGIVGLETAFPMLYTKLVKTGAITLGKLIGLLRTNPARRFGLESELEKGARADCCVFDLERVYTIDPAEFQSKGRATPFEGEQVYGRCLMTVSGGEIAWREA